MLFEDFKKERERRGVDRILRSAETRSTDPRFRYHTVRQAGLLARHLRFFAPIEIEFGDDAMALFSDAKERQVASQRVDFQPLPE